MKAAKINKEFRGPPLGSLVVPEQIEKYKGTKVFTSEESRHW
jgi:hypothetical protein